MTSRDRNDGGPAFPHTLSQAKDEKDEIYYYQTEGGMSLRDWFAGQALVGLAASGELSGSGAARMAAEYAYQVADAMLEARDKNRRTPLLDVDTL